MVDRARRGSALVYPIVFGRTAVPVLSDVAASPAGARSCCGTPRDLESALGSIARELRHQYLLGYAPAGAAEARPLAPDPGPRSWPPGRKLAGSRPGRV